MVRDVNNFKDILLTLSLRHQLMLAYRLDMTTLFKPRVEVKRASNVSVDMLASSVKQVMEKKTQYTKGMFVSFGSTSGLPDLCKIVHVLLV